MNKLSLHCLIVDDDSGDIEIVRRKLAVTSRFVITITPCRSIEAISEVATETKIDIILLDYQLGAITGLEALCLLREQGYSQPVIMLTGQGNEQVAVEAMKQGVTDYLVKDEVTTQVLELAIANALQKVELEARVEAQQRQILKQATTDSLTGLSNRCYSLQCLEKALQGAIRHNRPFSLLMLDLDHFKHINDTYGHPAGDKVLARTGQLIGSVLRGTDIAGRYGGEEFLIALDNTDLNGAAILAERLRQGMAQEPFPVGATRAIPVTCSIGVSCLDRDCGITDRETLLARADEALYLAKRGGRNQVAVNPRHEHLRSETSLRCHSPACMAPKGRILIVDDELLTLSLIGHILRPRVEVIYEASSGAEALAILGREQVDILITDLMMPEMDGLELMRQARSLLPDLQAIVVTGDESRDAVLTALRLGASNYLVKPVQVEELGIAVRQAMERIAMVRRLKSWEAQCTAGKKSLLWLMEAFPTPVFVIDDHGVCRFANQAATEFLDPQSSLSGNWRFGRLARAQGAEDIGIISPGLQPYLGTMRITRVTWDDVEVSCVILDDLRTVDDGPPAG